MRLQITLNMGAHKGGIVHQITCDHPAQSLHDFRDFIASHDFIVVKEFYKLTPPKVGEPGYDPAKRTELVDNGELIVNTSLIGKVRAYLP